jgi:hypothetical protein
MIKNPINAIESKLKSKMKNPPTTLSHLKDIPPKKVFQTVMTNLNKVTAAKVKTSTSSTL